MKNALVSLSNIVCDALEMGMSVDLAELGNLRVSVRPLSPQEKGGTLVFRPVWADIRIEMLTFAAELEKYANLKR